MIDIEPDVFTYVAEALRAAHPGIWVPAEPVNRLRSLPAATVLERSNRVHGRMRSSSGIENAAALMYELTVYSGSASGAKAEAKAILATGDAAFAECGFERRSCDPVPNFSDSNVYRIVARYEGVAKPGQDGNIYIYRN